MTKGIVTGGGIGGLATGIALRAAGFETDVFEQAPDASKVQVGGAYGLWYTGVRALQHLGLADGLKDIGGPLELFEFRDARGRLLASWDVGDRGRELNAPPVGVMRADLHRLLAEEYGPERIRFAAQCIGFRRTGERVVARFADGSEEAGDFLVGADGLRSAVRRQLHGEEKVRYPGYGHWSGYVDLERALTPPCVFRISYGWGARFAFLPSSPTRLCWWCTFPAERGDQPVEAGVKDRLLERFRGWGEPVEAIIDATPEASILRRDTVDRDPVDRWGSGRVTLAGDAAHPMTFNLGQGAGSALKDGVMLAKHLGAIPDIPRALRAYEATRMKPTTRWVKQSRQVGTLAALPGVPTSTTQNLVLRAFPFVVSRRIESDLDFGVRTRS